MAKLFNSQTEKLETIPEEFVEKAVLSGNYAFKKGERIPVQKPSGEFVTVPSEQLKLAIESGYKYEKAGEVEERKYEEEFGGDSMANDLKAATAGAARGLTFGLSDALLVNSGLVDQLTLEQLEKRNPYASMTGEIGGIIIPTILSGGTAVPGALGVAAKGSKALTTGVRGAEALGTLIGGKAAKKFSSEIAKKLAGTAVKGATEGALYGLGRSVTEEAFGNNGFSAEALINNVGYGAAMGGGIVSAITGTTAAKRVAVNKLKAKYGDDFLKGVGLGNSSGNSIPTKLIDLKTKSQDLFGKGKKYVEGKLDEGGLFKYSDDTRDVLLNPATVKGKVLDLTDDEQLYQLGKNLGLNDDLARLTKEDPAPLIGKKARQKKPVLTLDNLENRLINEKARQLAIDAGKTPKQMLLRAEKAVKSQLKQYDAFKDLERFRIVTNTGRTGVLDDVIESATRRGTKGTKPFDWSERGFLKSTGITQSFVDKLEKRFGRGYLRKKLIPEIQDSFKNKGAGVKGIATSLDDLSLRTDEKLMDAIEGMNNAINRAETLYDPTRLAANDRLTARNIRDFVESKIIKPNLTLEGQYKHPNMKAPLEKLRKWAADLDAAYMVDDGMGRRVSKELTPAEIREIRIKDIDKIINYEKTAPPAETTSYLYNELLKTVRGEIEDRVINAMDNLPGAAANDTARIYKTAKEKYHLNTEIRAMIDDGLKRRAGNNLMGLTSYISAGAGGAVAGIPGIVGGMAVRELGRRYGNQAAAILLRDVGTNHFKAVKQISKAVGGYVKNWKRPITSSIINATVDARSYEEIRDDVNQATQDLGAMIDQISGANDLMFQAAPNTANEMVDRLLRGASVLQEKMPKNPHEGNPFAKWSPPKSELKSFMRYYQAIKEPKTMLTSLENGYLGKEQVEVLNRVYPETLNEIRSAMMDQMDPEKTNLKQRQLLSKLFGLKSNQYSKIENIGMLQQNMIALNQQELAARPTEGMQKRQAGKNLTESQKLLA